MDKPKKLDKHQMHTEAELLSDSNSAYKLARLFLEKSEELEEIKYEQSKA
jgi:hypothetical protein